MHTTRTKTDCGTLTGLCPSAVVVCCSAARLDDRSAAWRLLAILAKPDCSRLKSGAPEVAHDGAE